MEYQDEFIQVRNRNFVGRREIMQKLRDYVESGDDSGAVSGSNNKPLVVVGTPGEGKSSLMANFARSYALDWCSVGLLVCCLLVAVGCGCCCVPCVICA